MSPNDPQRDPVYLFCTYEKKRPESMMIDEAPFSLSPCTAGQKGWFKQTPFGINSEWYLLMNEMKSDARIDDIRIKPYRYILIILYKRYVFIYSEKSVLWIVWYLGHGCDTITINASRLQYFSRYGVKSKFGMTALTHYDIFIKQS